jgi:aryl-alcohol dehydrogenase-like predicted oxidoreductase
MVSRRDFLGTTLGAGASLALTPRLLHALQLQQPGGTLIQRAIPSTGEMLPVIGLSRGNVPVDHAAFKEVLRTLVDNGGRVLDTVHGGAGAEQEMGTMASELGIQDRLFWSTKVSAPNRPPGAVAPAVDPAAARAHIEASFARFKVPRIDLMLVRPFDDVPGYLSVLREMKKEGRVRYIGVTAAFDNQYAQLEAIMRSEPIDFIGVDYAIDNRNVEETILPLARERKIGVMANFPFGGNVGPEGRAMSYLFARIGTAPLPAWAADFDAKTWGQFFLKYVISHPAVTAVRLGTSQPKHMLDNLAGGTGRLPNAATRKRMAELVDSLTKFVAVRVPTSVLERYVGEYEFPNYRFEVRLAGETLTARRVGMPATVPATRLVPLSETRFRQDNLSGWEVEFVTDQAGGVTKVLRMGDQEARGRRTPSP